MKIKLPKELTGTVFQKVFAVELNGIDMDLFLPALYFKILGDGKARARRLNDPQAIARYIDRLANHLEGAATPDGRRVLERLVRTSLVKTGRVGNTNRGEQILAIAPYSILAAKPGFPTESRRQRGADAFLYFALTRKVQEHKLLRDWLRQCFGRGVELERLPLIDGYYDGDTELDILSRLTIAFSTGFEATSVSTRRDTDTPPACPRQEQALADDLVSYLFAYSERMPSQALIAYLKPLLNLELFIYALRLVYAVNALVRDPSQLPAAMGDASEAAPPEIYLDFTGNVGGLSHQMAADTVRRDVEAYQHFFRANLSLRQLDGYVKRLKESRRHKDLVNANLPASEHGPAYLQAILALPKHPGLGLLIDIYAQEDIANILRTNQEAQRRGTQGEDRENLAAALEQLTVTAESDFERLVIMLDHAQRNKSMSAYMLWFASVGGINRSDGILAGVQRNRRSWRYAPSNELLAVLVQLAAVRMAPPNAAPDERVVAEIRLRDFLAFLERRFGFIIDRPPHGQHGAEYHAAARENLRAMLARLRQMGIFTDLSDDFTAQRLRPPYTTSRV